VSIYQAFLVDGPVGGQHFGLVTAHPLPDVLLVAPTPEGVGPLDGWLIVGTERTETPVLDGQCTYELDVAASIISDDRGIVIYSYAESESS
jgi:hypothetical protein